MRNNLWRKITFTLMAILMLAFVNCNVAKVASPALELEELEEPARAANDKVVFMDPVFEEAVRNTIKPRPTGHITYADVAKITKFIYNGYGEPKIRNIKGIEHFTSLTTLNLQGNLIGDLRPLANLTNLSELYLSGNRVIADISPLSRLTSLTELGLIDNHIRDLRPLRNLRSLTLLSLGRNQIVDITPLENLRSLTHLSLHNNKISNIWTLRKMTSLTSLWIHNNRIRDIRALMYNRGLGYGCYIYILTGNNIPQWQVYSVERKGARVE